MISFPFVGMDQRYFPSREGVMWILYSEVVKGSYVRAGRDGGGVQVGCAARQSVVLVAGLSDALETKARFRTNR